MGGRRRRSGGRRSGGRRKRTPRAHCRRKVRVTSRRHPSRRHPCRATPCMHCPSGVTTLTLSLTRRAAHALTLSLTRRAAHALTLSLTRRTSHQASHAGALLVRLLQVQPRLLSSTSPSDLALSPCSLTLDLSAPHHLRPPSDHLRPRSDGEARLKRRPKRLTDGRTAAAAPKGM